MNALRVVVVGLGVQGVKRARVAGADLVTTVDPVNPAAAHRSLDDLDWNSFDAALLCVPDATKIALIERLLDAGKHVLVEKPLLSDRPGDLAKLDTLAKARGAVCYTAYNHRFEPHIARLAEELASEKFGRIYRARFFYGNGTARDVRESAWRDQGAGVLPDLGSHLLDMQLFLFGALPEKFEVWGARRFENRAFDHFLCGSNGPTLIEMEMTLLSWRNHFVAELIGERGSVSIASLCKWGPSSYTRTLRVLPSGRPPEESIVLTQPDPTWDAEYAHFKRLCATGGPSNVANDIVIDAALRSLHAQADAKAGT
jgi:predicted dehydrogenase